MYYIFNKSQCIANNILTPSSSNFKTNSVNLVSESGGIVGRRCVMVGDVEVVHWVTADHVVAVGRVNTKGHKVVI